MPEKAHLRVHGHGEVEVELITGYLADLAHAYNSILVFESVMDGMRRASRDYPFPLQPFAFVPGWPLAPRRTISHLRDWRRRRKSHH